MFKLNALFELSSIIAHHWDGAPGISADPIQAAADAAQHVGWDGRRCPGCPIATKHMNPGAAPAVAPCARFHAPYNGVLMIFYAHSTAVELPLITKNRSTGGAQRGYRRIRPVGRRGDRAIARHLLRPLGLCNKFFFDSVTSKAGSYPSTFT